MTTRPFEEIDFSGDVGIDATGATLAELFGHVTAGLLSLMTSGAVEKSVTREVTASAGSSDDLLVDWLNEVIRLAATHGERYHDVVDVDVGETAARGVLRGEAVDEARHRLRFDVKAATYHGLSVRREGNVWRARVVFDL